MSKASMFNKVEKTRTRAAKKDNVTLKKKKRAVPRKNIKDPILSEITSLEDSIEYYLNVQ